MLKLDLEKAEELEIKLPTPKLLFDNQIAFWIIKKTRDFQKSVYFCFIVYAKAFDCVDHNKLWKILKEMGIPDHLTCLLRNLYQVRKQQFELDMEQQAGFHLEKEYVKAI